MENFRIHGWGKVDVDENERILHEGESMLSFSKLNIADMFMCATLREILH